MSTSAPTLPAAIWLPWAVPLLIGLAVRVCVVLPDAQAKAAVSNRALLISLTRYRERVGDEYSIEDPASLAFEFKLLNVEEGRTILTTPMRK